MPPTPCKKNVMDSLGSSFRCQFGVHLEPCGPILAPFEILEAPVGGPLGLFGATLWSWQGLGTILRQFWSQFGCPNEAKILQKVIQGSSQKRHRKKDWESIRKAHGTRYTIHEYTSTRYRGRRQKEEEVWYVFCNQVDFLKYSFALTVRDSADHNELIN